MLNCNGLLLFCAWCIHRNGSRRAVAAVSLTGEDRYPGVAGDSSTCTSARLGLLSPCWYRSENSRPGTHSRALSQWPPVSPPTLPLLPRYSAFVVSGHSSGIKIWSEKRILLRELLKTGRKRKLLHLYPTHPLPLQQVLRLKIRRQEKKSLRLETTQSYQNTCFVMQKNQTAVHSDESWDDCQAPGSSTKLTFTRCSNRSQHRAGRLSACSMQLEILFINICANPDERAVWMVRIYSSDFFKHSLKI